MWGDGPAWPKSSQPRSNTPTWDALWREFREKAWFPWLIIRAVISGVLALLLLGILLRAIFFLD
jgi:hypothetical protein